MEGTSTESVRRRPVLDLSRCSDCEACLDLCPEVFHRHSATGRIEVVDLPAYPEEAVAEVIIGCPRDCIEWEYEP